nr:Uma2 family endonuclease [uncultured Chloroflexus sp.]
MTRREKRDRYAAAGVREYWIADPQPSGGRTADVRGKRLPRRACLPRAGDGAKHGVARMADSDRAIVW